MSDISIPEESEIKPMKINEFKTKVSLAETNSNNFTLSECGKKCINDNLNNNILSSDKYVYYHKNNESKNEQKFHNDEEKDYDIKDLDELKICENMNKFKNHNAINKETISNNFSLHRPGSRLNTEEFLVQSRNELNEANRSSEKTLSNILSNNYPLNSQFVHCRNCMLILAIRGKYYINK